MQPAIWTQIWDLRPRALLLSKTKIDASPEYLKHRPQQSAVSRVARLIAMGGKKSQPMLEAWQVVLF